MDVVPQITDSLNIPNEKETMARMRRVWERYRGPVATSDKVRYLGEIASGYLTDCRGRLTSSVRHRQSRNVEHVDESCCYPSG